MRPIRFYYQVSFLALLCLILAVAFSSFFSQSSDQIAETASRKIAKKVAAFKAVSLADEVAVRQLYRQEKLGVYQFHDSVLVTWNNSRIPFQERLSDFSDSFGCKQLRHGFYFYYKTQTDSKHEVLLLCPIKPQYQLQNNYLNNDFETWTGIPRELKLTSKETDASTVNFQGKPLFQIAGTEATYHSKLVDFWAGVLFLLGSMLLAGAALFYSMRITVLRSTLLVASIFLIRVAMIVFHAPAFLYRSEWYDVRVFGNADSFFNAYLGDMLINSLLLLLLSVFLRGRLNGTLSGPSMKWQTLWLALLLALIAVSFNHSLVSLVSNSTISFDFLNVLNLQLPALTALAVLCFYGLAFYITLHALTRSFQGSVIKIFVNCSALTAVIGFGLLAIQSEHNWLEAFWPLVLGVFTGVLLHVLKGRPQLSLSIYIVLLSLLCSRLLNAHIISNERQELKLLSYKLSERVDPVLESEFTSIPQRIINDQNLRNLLGILPASAEGVSSLVKQHYLTGYFDRYQIELQLFDRDCHPLLAVNDGRLNNSGYIEDQIRTQSDSSAIEGLYFVSKFQRNTRYIAAIDLRDYKMYIRLDMKQFEELGTFPDLLLDRSQQRHEKLNAFSHAVYRSDELSSQYGDLSYPFLLQDSLTLSATQPEFLHHFYYPEEGSVIIISEKIHSLSQFFTANSYLLLYFSLIGFLCYLAHALLFADRLRAPSLTRRIQSIVILLLLVSMSAIGYTSTRLVTAQFEADNKRELEEKTQVILGELGAEFTHEEIFDESRRDLINLKLKEYARLFNTPISLFDKDGRLFTTSETKLYDLGLAAGLVNPYAYTQLKNNRSSSEPVYEKAGSLTYLSFYTPVISKKSDLLGFVNLPYFARQSALVDELSGIISALANVYVLLFVLSILAGLILAGYITQPLRLIQQQIANISLGKKNEKITWNSNDEIGRLVAEYNDMLVKLEESANLLAQSERESAWREMARQVAHEIKNPLTPMKLNLQYLQHVMKSNDSEFKEKFEKSASAIIEQIDALANIATEFSNFARLPSGSLKAIPLSEIIETSVQLFQEDSRVNILNHLKDSNLIVNGDREQCLRVFNNILKNAVQALDATEMPVIIIDSTASQDPSSVIVSVSDNGCGISETEREKIFRPNFTTKSTGSGLGLSMVKNIMEGFEGRIWFESTEGKGTTFFLEFKKSGQ